MSQDPKVIRRQKLRWRIRTKIHGTAQKPRLSVFRSNKDIYAQLIDDNTGTTLAAASSREKDIVAQGGVKVASSLSVGKAIADGAREGGLKF
jgi:large subunit ribosomal protein L18